MLIIKILLTILGVVFMGWILSLGKDFNEKREDWKDYE